MQIIDVFSSVGILLNFKGELKVKFDDLDSIAVFTGEIFIFW